MKNRNVSKVIFVVISLILVLQITGIEAKVPKAKIQYVTYCDLDADGKEDDVYAEVFLKMGDGIKYLVIEASLYFEGDLIYSIYRDNHVRTEDKIVYKIFFINVAYESGWYDLQVWFEITNGDNIDLVYDQASFDPPGGDPDVPPGGGFDPGP